MLSSRGIFLEEDSRIESRIEPLCLASPALAGRFFTTSTTWEAGMSLHQRPDWCSFIMGHTW